MAYQQIYNLDEGAREYFEFTVKGNSYKFRHLSAREVEQFDELRQTKSDSKEDTAEAKEVNQKFLDFMFGFVTPVDDAPEFKEIWKDMLTPWRNNFIAMVEFEFGKVSNKNFKK